MVQQEFKSLEGHLNIQTGIPNSQLKAIAYEHISYEIQMFVYTGEKIRRGNLNNAETNVMLESFLLHSRCLLDFLYPASNIRNDDVTAYDFFDDPNTLKNKIALSLPMSEYLKFRTGKEIAHLTYGRLNVTKEGKIWQIGEIHDQLGEALATFFDCLSDEQRGWFSTIISR